MSEMAFGVDARSHPNTANEKLAWAAAEIDRLRATVARRTKQGAEWAAEIDRLRDALTGIYRGAPRMSHAHLTAAAALGLIDRDGSIKEACALPAPDKEG